MSLSFVSSMFVFGLATSVHCVAMCGGLVLTYAVKGTEGGPWYRRLLPHLAYQGSKIVSYATVALVLGGLAAVASVVVSEQTTKPVLNWVQLVAGIYMILLGVGMTGKVKALRHLTPRPPQFLVRALSRNRKKAVSDASEGRPSLATPIAFGLLTGLMPCSPLIGAQVQAVAQGSVLTSVAGMAAFGLGTMPLTLAFGLTSDLLSHRFRTYMNVVAAIAVILFGLVFLNRGLGAVGSPVTFETVTAGISSPSDAPQYTRGADGVIEIPLAIINTEYVPNVLRIPADIPVRLIVDRQEDIVCSNELVIKSAGIQVKLTPNGVTKVDLPPMKAGTYKMTCQMNMMSGSIIAGGGSPWMLPVALLAIALGAIGYGLVRWRNHKKPPVANSTGKKGAPAPPSSKAMILGFELHEVIIGVGVVMIAIVVGLWFGGFFH